MDFINETDLEAIRKKQKLWFILCLCTRQTKKTEAAELISEENLNEEINVESL
jgi:hypothetical protein